MDATLRAVITGTGMCLPEKVLTNFDLAKMVDTSDEWIVTRTGIRERRIAAPNVATSDLAAAAASRALSEAGIPANDLDLIIVATVTPDNVFPCTACHVQRIIGASKAAAFDLSVACAGFVYGLAVADGLIRSSSPLRNILVIGAECLSRIVDYTDRTSCILFGDGAGAAIVQPKLDGRGILGSCLGADGAQADLIIVPAGGSRMPASPETVQNRMHFMKLRGREVFKFAVIKMVEMIEASVKQCGLSLSDVSLIIPHQVNMRIIDAAIERLGIPAEKFFVNIDRYGNTSAASVPIALHEARASGRLRSGDVVVLVGFGGGLAWGASVLRW